MHPYLNQEEYISFALDENIGSLLNMPALIFMDEHEESEFI